MEIALLVAANGCHCYAAIRELFHSACLFAWIPLIPFFIVVVASHFWLEISTKYLESS